MVAAVEADARVVNANWDVGLDEISIFFANQSSSPRTAASPWSRRPGTVAATTTGAVSLLLGLDPT